MKKTLIISILFITLTIFSQENDHGDKFDLFGGIIYPDNSLNISFEDDGGIIVSGEAGNGAGYVIESDDLGLTGRNILTMKITDLTNESHFDSFKLLKLEINNNPIITDTMRMKNRNDSTFINARNGIAKFNIGSLGIIQKINLVFYQCTLQNVKVEFFIR